MSIKNRLEKKTGDLSKSFVDAKDIDSQNSITPSDVKQMPRTGPGQMLAFRAHMQQNNQIVKDLQDQLKEFDGSLVVKMIDPKLIHPSKWANRHDASYSSNEFIELKADIAAAGINVQPIRIRPIIEDFGNFEIIYGHRRHQACLQLDIPIAAIIETVDDKELFKAMDRENRSREDLSPFEQGEMYRRALDDGLYPSLRQLAYELGIDPGGVSKAIAVARLPKEVIEVFENPTLIQYRWGRKLTLAVEKDLDNVLTQARKIRFSENPLEPADALERLLGNTKPTQTETTDILKNGKKIGRIERKKDGSFFIDIKAGVLNDDEFSNLAQLIEGMIK